MYDAFFGECLQGKRRARQNVSQLPLSPSIGFHGRRLRLQDTDSPLFDEFLVEKTGGIDSKLGTALL